MIIKNIYRYIREDGGTTISPNEAGQDYTPMFRLIADKGMVLQKGDSGFLHVVDVENTEGWLEVEEPIVEEAVPVQEEESEITIDEEPSYLETIDAYARLFQDPNQEENPAPQKNSTTIILTPMEYAEWKDFVVAMRNKTHDIEDILSELITALITQGVITNV